MIYDLEKRVFLVKKYYEIKDTVTIQRIYRSKFNEKIAPNHKVIKNIINSFEKTGSVIY